MKRLTTRQCGSAIAVTLIAIAAMTTITLGVAGLVPRDFRQSQALENSLVSEQAAWSGIERALLSLKEDRFFELSGELVNSKTARPYGRFDRECTFNRFECAKTRSGFDRQLGTPINQTPVEFESNADLGLGPEVHYSVLVWHMVQQLGTIQTNDLHDQLPDHSRSSANINPILERDETRVLDVTRRDDSTLGVDKVTLRWSPIFHPKSDDFNGECLANPNSKFVLAYTWLNSDESVYSQGEEISDLARGLLTLDFSPSGDSTRDQTKTLLNPNVISALRLQLRFLATTTSADDTSIGDCFMRYSIETHGANDSVDLGFSVIDATGFSGSTRRKIRVFVDRQNGSINSIFDFGVACQICKDNS